MSLYLVPTLPATNTWHDALSSYAQHLHGSARSAATVESYCKHVRWLAEAAAVPGHGPWDVPPATVQTWLNAQNWSAGTARKVLVSLRSFYRWGVDTGQCERSPLAGLAKVTSKSRGPSRIEPTRQWVEPIDGFLRHLEAAGRMPGTLDQHRTRLTNVSHSFADPWRVTLDDLERYLSRPDWSAEYKRHGRSSLRRFYAWSVRAGHVAHDPTDGLEPVRMRRALPRPTPADTVLEALRQADHRQRLIIELAMYAGLRRGEVARVSVDDVSECQLLVHGKGGHQRIVPLHPSLALSLTAELERRARAGVESPWLFPSAHGGHLTPAHVGKLARACLKGKWTTHTLRHRFGSQAYAATRDLRAVQELLGHAKPETTAIYAAVPDGALTAAVAGVGLL